MADSALASREAILDLVGRVNQDIVGQERVVKRIVLALLADGNVLLEGLPGLAKTRAIKSLSKNVESAFSRIQFTPDLLPSDVTGGEILKGDGSFEFRKGPIFGNLVLADEINRARQGAIGAPRGHGGAARDGGGNQQYVVEGDDLIGRLID